MKNKVWKEIGPTSFGAISDYNLNLSDIFDISAEIITIRSQPIEDFIVDVVKTKLNKTYYEKILEV